MKCGLAGYFVVFLLFLYVPMILMAILSFQGYYGALTFPFRGPFSGSWWKSLFDSSIPGSIANDDAAARPAESLWLSLAAGAIVALLAFIALGCVPAALALQDGRASPST